MTYYFKIMNIQFEKKSLLKGEKKNALPKGNNKSITNCIYFTPTTPQIHGKSYKPSRIFNLHANKEPYDDRVMLSKVIIYDVNVKSNYVFVKKR